MYKVREDTTNRGDLLRLMCVYTYDLPLVWVSIFMLCVLTMHCGSTTVGIAP